MGNNRNKYDDLDELFRSRLKSENPSQNEWNVPPDSILDQVQNHLTESNKKKRKVILYWVFAAILFFSLIGLQVYTSAKVNELSQAVKYNNQQLKESITTEKNPSTETKEIYNSQIKTEELKINTQATQAVSEGVYSENSKEIETKSLKTNFIENPSRGGFAELKKDEMDMGEFIEKSGLIEFGTNNSVSKSISSIDAGVQKLTAIDKNSTRLSFDKLPIISLQLLEYQRELTPMYFEINEYKPVLSKKKLEGYVFSSLTMSSFRMTNTENNDFSLTKYDKNYLGYQLGIGLKINLLKNLQLNSSLSWSRLNNQSLYEDEMNFIPENESINAQGERMYDTELNVESPMSSYSASVRFGLSNQQISSDDYLMNTTEISQDFSLLNLNIGVDYTFLTAGKIQFFVGSGLSGNYLFKLDQKMDSELVFSDKVLMSDSFSSKSMEEIDPYFLSVYGNLGMKYELSDRIYFQLNGAWETSLTPLRTTKSENSSSTFLSHLKTQVHLAYRF